VFTQVDEAGLVADDLQNLSLPIHHIFVLQNLLDGYHFASLLLLSLYAKSTISKITPERTYFINLAESATAEHLQKVVFVEFARWLRCGSRSDTTPRRLPHCVDHLRELRREVGRGRLVPILSGGSWPAVRIGLGKNFVQLEGLLLSLLSGFLHSNLINFKGCPSLVLWVNSIIKQAG